MPGAISTSVSRRFLNGAISAAAAVVLMAATCDTATADGADRWTIIEVAGGVELKKPGEDWRAPTAGTVVPPGSAVRTGAGAKLVLDSKGDTVTMSPNSRMDIPDGPTGPGAINVEQSLGTLLFKIVKRPADRFRVQTPYLAAVIKGTTFSVTVNDRGAALHVSTGAVEVTSLLSRRVAMVRPGQTAMVPSQRGAPMSLSGGKAKKAPADQGARNDGAPAIGPSAGRGLDAAPGGAAVGPERTGNNLITNTIGARRIDVFEATNGLIEGDGSGAGSSRDRDTRKGGGRVAGRSGGSAPKTGEAPKISAPKSVTSALQTVTSTTSTVQSTVNNVTNTVNLPGLP